MFFELVSITLAVVNCGFTVKHIRRLRREHLEKQQQSVDASNNIIDEIVSSLEGDDDWVFYPAIKEQNICDSYLNSSSGIGVSLSNNIRGGIGYGAIYKPIIKALSFEDMKRIELALEKWKYKQIINARIKGFENITAKLEKEEINIPERSKNDYRDLDIEIAVINAKKVLDDNIVVAKPQKTRSKRKSA